MTDQSRPTNPVYVSTDALRTDESQSSCLRPLGLCELGGSCDSCWYSPDHPRFREGRRTDPASVEFVDAGAGAGDLGVDT
jgi:hypothetical protein